MLNRLSLLARHISRPAIPVSNLAGARSGGSITSLTMSGSTSAQVQQKSAIHTAGCVIIGDEVLGGKVCSLFIISYLFHFLICLFWGLELGLRLRFGDMDG